MIDTIRRWPWLAQMAWWGIASWLFVGFALVAAMGWVRS
jgi:hypothetical protein